MIRKALPNDENSVVEIDKAIIGTEKHRKKINCAISDEMCILSETNHCITGFAIMGYHFFDFGFVEHLMIHPDYQRQGIGYALLQKCVGNCCTAKMFISTNSTNLPMRGLLRKADFIFCGEITHLDEDNSEFVYMAPSTFV